MDWIGVDWIGLDWSGVEWSGLEWSVDWSGLDWSGVEWSVVKGINPSMRKYSSSDRRLQKYHFFLVPHVCPVLKFAQD